MIFNAERDSLGNILIESLELPLDEVVYNIDTRLDNIKDDGVVTTQIQMEKNPIKKIINLMMEYSDKRYRVRYRKFREVSDEVNEIYDEINRMLKSDISARNVHARDTVKGKVYRLMVLDKKTKKKKYKFDYAAVRVPINQVVDMIRNTMKIYPNNPDRLSDVQRQVDEFIDQQYWFVNDTEADYIEDKQSASLESFIAYTKDSLDQLYAVQVNESRYMSENNLYFLAIKKCYIDMEREFGSNKVAMKYIDNIFKRSLKITQQGLDWNFDGSTKAYKLYKSLFKQLEEFYDIIRE